MTTITSISNTNYQQPSRLHSGIAGAGIGAAISGGILLGDKYFPNVTHKAIQLVNFESPDSKKITEPVFAKFSTGTKVKAVAGIVLLTGLLGFLFNAGNNN